MQDPRARSIWSRTRETARATLRKFQVARSGKAHGEKDPFVPSQVASARTDEDGNDWKADEERDEQGSCGGHESEKSCKLLAPESRDAESRAEKVENRELRE